jgi:hypothetical protein
VRSSVLVFTHGQGDQLPPRWEELTTRRNQVRKRRLKGEREGRNESRKEDETRK